MIAVSRIGNRNFIVHDYDSGGGDGDGKTELLEWVKRMIFLGIFLTILLQVLPNGTYRKYVRFFAGMVFVLTIVSPLFSILGQKNWEQTLERELLQEDVLQSGQLDFSYMERQQQAYYEVQTKDAVAQMIEKLGEMNGCPVQQVEVNLSEDDGSILQVKVWTAVTSEQSRQRMQEETAQACGISADQVEVYEA